MKITKEQLLEERALLLKQAEHIEKILEIQFGWIPSDPINNVLSAKSSPKIESDSEVKSHPIRYQEEAYEWIKQAKGNVTSKDFKLWLSNKFPNKAVNINSINAPIRRLVEEGKLKIVTRGAGKIATLYEVVGKS